MTIPRTCSKLLAVIMLGALLGSSAAFAQSSRYSADWRDPDASQQAQPGTGEVQSLVDELNQLIDSATAARAADPAFLRDLRDLARRFDWPWRKRVLFDDFADGNVDANPAWRVGGAPVTVDRFDGLRSRVALDTGQASGAGEEAAQPEELAVKLLGQILSQSGSGSQQRQPATPSYTESVMATSAGTSNQFALQADIVFADAVNGYIELGVIQGTDGLGYRVGIRPGANDAAVEILRVGSRGSGVVDSAQIAPAVWTAQPASQPRTLLFTRDDVGAMKVSIDGNLVLSANDRAFRDGFDGFIVRNGGGDYLIKAIAGYSK